MRQKAEEEMEKRRQEAAARQQASKAPQPAEDDFATKMMKKMGWKDGAGLGKEGQGMVNPLVMQKTDQKTGRIVEGTKREAAAPPPNQPDAKQVAEGKRGPPTRVLLLTNMVGAGDVDEDLQEETAEEASKYGKLKKCVIKELAGKPDDQAVRIFLEYEDVAAATKAFADMNGRYFGGRVVKARFFEETLFSEGQLEAA
ncbi:RBM17 [Symbiodinium pilosum]|uniref:RBM17 protein n=1 Tax=Symbiodinium pilosum TaxID=2952 RepID=A0A812YA41_SYMPI|nr:RBM17 [Symbiodinium pilosum]